MHDLQVLMQHVEKIKDYANSQSTQFVELWNKTTHFATLVNQKFLNLQEQIQTDHSMLANTVQSLTSWAKEVKTLGTTIGNQTHFLFNVLDTQDRLLGYSSTLLRRVQIFKSLMLSMIIYGE